MNPPRGFQDAMRSMVWIGHAPRKPTEAEAAAALDAKQARRREQQARYAREHRAKVKAETPDLCPRCRSPFTSRCGALCESCAALNRAESRRNSARRRAEAVAAGMCSLCRKRERRDGFADCERCAEKRRRYKKARKTREPKPCAMDGCRGVVTDMRRKCCNRCGNYRSKA